MSRPDWHEMENSCLVEMLKTCGCLALLALMCSGCLSGCVALLSR
jgi:hypothetical protein